MNALMKPEEDREVQRQVQDMLGKSAAFRALEAGERTKISSNTADIVRTMVQNRAASNDAYAVPFAGPGPVTPGGLPNSGLGGAPRPTFTGGAQPVSGEKFGPKNIGDFGTGIATGVAQAGELLRQVNFPQFVAELVQGVFQAVVDASIQQMKAYGELVQSVAMSLNDFRDQNVSPNQGRDHLVGKYPSLMQIKLVDGEPRVGVKPGADTSSLPNFRAEMNLSEEITDLDDEIIEEHLVPAARNDLARSRQTLLATMVLMGINRIVVTDGKINAKLKFDFHATDHMTTHAQNWDYANMGTTETRQTSLEEQMETGENYSSRQSNGWTGRSRATTGSSNRWTKELEQTTSTPAIYVTSQTDTTTQAALEASAKLSGEVSLNFRTESFDLNKLASADEIFKLERIRSAGRAAPGAPASAGSAAPGQPPAQGNTGASGGAGTQPGAGGTPPNS